MKTRRMRLWKLALLGGVLALSGWLGWRYADRRTTILLALNTNTGKLQWVHPISPSVLSKGAIAGDGKVLLSSSGPDFGEARFSFYQLQALNAQSGKILWTYRPKGAYTPFEVAFNPSVKFQNNQLYIQIGDELRALDPGTGKIRWAILRPWFEAGVFRSDLGLVTLSNQVALIRPNPRQRLLQFLDPQTGKLLNQTTLSLPDLTSTNNYIATNNRSIFLETSGLIQTGANEFQSNGRSTVTAHDIKTGQLSFRTEITGQISNLQVVQNTLQASISSTRYGKEAEQFIEASLLAIDADTGRVLWQKSRKQLDCLNIGYSWRVGLDSVYVNCNRRSEAPESRNSSTIVALSAQTGRILWRSQVSSHYYSRFLPNVVNAQQFLTFRQVKNGSSRQTQAIAINRQTGKLRWSFALYDDEYVDAFGSFVATERDRLFVLDRMPRWQIWLLQRHPDWHLKQLL